MKNIMSSLATVADRPDALERRPLISNSVAGTILFVFTEVMLFAGFISAHMVYVSNQVGELWPPADQPLLPFRQTALNSSALMISGLVLFMAWRAFRSERREARGLLGLATLLGLFFVGSQGVEWLALIREGLTLTSSAYGAFFYMIVGAHAIHALGGILALVWAWFRLSAGQLSGAQFASVQVFWYFVVAVWPVIFLQVYGYGM